MISQLSAQPAKTEKDYTFPWRAVGSGLNLTHVLHNLGYTTFCFTFRKSPNYYQYIAVDVFGDKDMSSVWDRAYSRYSEMIRDSD